MKSKAKHQILKQSTTRLSLNPRNINIFVALNYAVSIIDYVASMTVCLTNDESERIWKETDMTKLYYHPTIPGGTEETHRTIRQPVYLLRFEPGTSRIQFLNITPTPNSSVWNMKFIQATCKTSVPASQRTVSVLQTPTG
jgi:hypothetical protein